MCSCRQERPTLSPRGSISEINRALADAAVLRGFEQQAQETVGGDVGQFSRLFQEDYEKYARLMKDLKIKIN